MHEELASFVKKKVVLVEDEGRGDYYLYEMMKNLKARLKVWNK